MHNAYPSNFGRHIPAPSHTRHCCRPPESRSCPVLSLLVAIVTAPALGRAAQYCDDVSVCLSVCKRISATRRLIFTNFLRTSLMSVTRSCSGGAAALRLRCALPVLCMTSCLRIVVRNRRRNKGKGYRSTAVSVTTAGTPYGVGCTCRGGV